MSDNRHFDQHGQPHPTDEELFNVAGRLGELHRAVQIAAAGTWRGQFPAMVADALLGPGARDLADGDRRELLREARDSLNRVVDQLGLPPDRYPAQPATLTATDRTPRRDVWEARLRDLPGDSLFGQWPAPLREHIVTAAVEREAGIVDQNLRDYYEEVEDALPTWRWDAERLEAVHTGGYLEPANEPDIDDFLDDARSEVEPFLGHIQVGAVATWIDQQLQALTDRGWTVDRIQDYQRAVPDWSFDYERHRLALHTAPHAHLQLTDRPFSAAEAAAYPVLARLIADALTRPPPSPAAAAFPEQAPTAATDDTDPESGAAPQAPVAGPQR